MQAHVNLVKDLLETDHFKQIEIPKAAALRARRKHIPIYA
jgi:hypothetical protein